MQAKTQVKSTAEQEFDVGGIIKALADENRIAIVELVASEEEPCASDLLDKLEISQPTLSHHMKALCSCGLLESRKDGRLRRYRVNTRALDATLGFMGSLRPEA